MPPFINVHLAILPGMPGRYYGIHLSNLYPLSANGVISLTAPARLSKLLDLIKMLRKN